MGFARCDIGFVGCIGFVRGQFGSARVLRYKHVGICDARSSCSGSIPMPGPEAKWFAFWQNIGFMVYYHTTSPTSPVSFPGHSFLAVAPTAVLGHSTLPTVSWSQVGVSEGLTDKILCL